ncbi:hypothetical protein BWI17_00630 [Betaproteobacteria bacterium GR16-43]|nr:hypothetical protein BWI17_00630 [Betaproteobacteria bacterium GR16-43]
MSLMSDPRRWTKASISSWPRFVMSLGLPAMAIFFAVTYGKDHPLNLGVYFGIFALGYHAMFLYALRRIYRQSEGLESEAVRAI